MKNTLLSPLILIDGTFYLYRFYYAMPILKNHKNQDTNVIFGILNLIEKLLIQHKTKKIAIIFDSKEKNFRNKIFDKYKAHRKKMPQSLILQSKMLYKILNLLGIPIIIMKGVEADDVIGTFAIQSNKDKHPVIIYTGDKDMLQLISTNIKVHLTHTNTIYGIKEIQDKYGFLPQLIVDFISLVGDRSDNIPGIPGIGIKTAYLLLTKLGNLIKIYSNLESIKNLSIKRSKSIFKILKEHKEKVFMYYKLASIKTNVKINIFYNKLIIKNIKQEKKIKILKKYLY